MKRTRMIIKITAVLSGILLCSSVAFGRDISNLCIKAGIEGKDLVTIKAAYIEAVNSGIDEEELYVFFEAILNHGLNCPQLVSVLSKSTQLKQEGLPFWPLFSKVREGITKGIPPGKIVQVVDEKTGSLGQASRVIEKLKAKQYVVKNYDGAVILISSFIEKGYTSDEIIGRIFQKGLENTGFSGITEVIGQGKK